MVSSKEAAEDLQSVLAEVDDLAKELLSAGDWSARNAVEERIETAQLALLVSAIERLAPSNEAYGTALNGGWAEDRAKRIKRLHGVVFALQKDYAKGRLRGYEAIVRGEIFQDLLDAAERIAADGTYGKDAAANLAGPVLENHLRKLAAKHNISDRLPDGVKPKPTSVLAADLAKTQPAPAISKQTEKEIAAWLGIRNSAAHGKFADYDVKQVELMVDGIRGFINRYPAP